MNNKIDIDLKRFNAECKNEGKKPFPLEKVTIDFQDENHFNESIKIWKDALCKWWNQQ